MTYSKEQYDNDLAALQEKFVGQRANITWSDKDVYAYLEILRARLENFNSYSLPSTTTYPYIGGTVSASGVPSNTVTIGASDNNYEPRGCCP